MEETIQKLYNLAEHDEVAIDDLINALNIERSGEDTVYSDSVADLAASIEGALSVG